MKMPTRLIRLFLTMAALLVLTPEVQGQLLKRLKKSAERAAERTIERRVDEEASEKTDAALDSILEPESEQEMEEDVEEEEFPLSEEEIMETETGSNTSGSTKPTSKGTSGTFKVYTNYDFVAGNKLLLYEDFSVDKIGDFPAKWNTNGAGEVVKINEGDEKWLQLANETTYIPDLAGTLPKDYTLEFDMITTGLNKETGSLARIIITLDDNNMLRRGSDFAEVSLPLCQFTDPGVYVGNYFNDETTVRNYIIKDIRKDVLERAHVAIAVNGPRFRLWMNERKLVDLPRFIVSGLPKYIKFDLGGMLGEDSGQFAFLTNIKLAEGGEDVRSLLVKEGKFSTTGILFDPASDKIKPESYGTLKLISEALVSESGMQIQIVGHTDADGSDESNLELSKRRANSVKNSLVQEFGIAADRLESDGKGETAPVADNTTTAGKAENRRVEFVKN